MSKKEISNLTSDEYEPEEMPKRDVFWGDLTRVTSDEDKKEYLVSTENLIHVSGGGIPLLFGNEQSNIWQAVVETASNNGGQIEFAGVTFSLDELKLLGEFYRFLRDKKKKSFTCIDDRLKVGQDGHDPKTCFIHEGCGAAGAIDATIKEALSSLISDTTVENLAVEELGQEKKQPLVEDMREAHETSVILITFGSNGQAVNPDRFDDFRDNNALPMNATIPLELVEDFISYIVSLDPVVNHSHKREELLSVLFKWNVDIAKAVINNKKHNHNGGAENILVVAHCPGELGHQSINVLRRYLINIDQQDQAGKQVTDKTDSSQEVRDVDQNQQDPTAGQVTDQTESGKDTGDVRGGKVVKDRYFILS